MPSRTSDVALLVLHAVRLGGMTTPAAAATRFGLDQAAVEELLLDFAAYGWVSHTEFAGTGGWSLTDAGRTEDERRLSAELQDAAAEPVVEDVHLRFLPLNARFQEAVTKWQVRPQPGDELARNDHTDFRWDDRVLDSLERTVGHALALVGTLSGVLTRFDGYGARLQRALTAVTSGRRNWVDGLDVDSLHRIWFELHEDLLATLGRQRGDEPAAE
jgi:hypothetical protein